MFLAVAPNVQILMHLPRIIDCFRNPWECQENTSPTTKFSVREAQLKVCFEAPLINLVTFIGNVLADYPQYPPYGPWNISNFFSFTSQQDARTVSKSRMSFRTSKVYHILTPFPYSYPPTTPTPASIPQAEPPFLVECQENNTQGGFEPCGDNSRILRCRSLERDFSMRHR